MSRTARVLLPSAVTLIALILVLPQLSTSNLYARHKKRKEVIPNGPNSRLFQLLDNSYGGKLKNFYVLGGVVSNPKQPSQQLQRVMRLDYNKNLAFGKLTIIVRYVSRLSPEQVDTYTPKQIYHFGGMDAEKFIKTSAGPFGGAGDLYLRAVGDLPLESKPITDEVQKKYDQIITKHILPALEKSAKVSTAIGSS